MNTKFLPSQFTATKFETAEDKAEFANRFVRFVESGYNPNIFTKKFYTRLSMCFGHIAHYDQGGFYHTFFTSLEGRLNFAQATENREIYGDPSYTDSDVEKVLQAWARDYGMVAKARKNLYAGIEKEERAELARLQTKYESQ
jgi:hypothetical protein